MPMTSLEQNTALEGPLPSRTETSSLLIKPQYQQYSDSRDCYVNGLEANMLAPRPEAAERMYLFLFAVGIGVYLVAIDQLLTVAAYASIGNELNSLNSMSWIATSYLLTLTSFQPLYGKLTDIFGRKECLLSAYAIFAIGCLGCGLCQNIAQLCISRAIAGVGGAGMSAVVSIILSDLVPLRERGIWQGYLNIIYAAGTSTGAPLGGFLADSIGWRWSFLVQVPLCVIGYVTVNLFLHLSPPEQTHWLKKLYKVDFLGAFVLVLAVLAVLVGLDLGPNRGWSYSGTIIALITAPILFAFFIFIEIKVASYPFAPGQIIFDGGLFPCYLANFFGSAGQFGILYLLPLYLQAVKSYSATMSAALMIPAMITGTIASISSGMLIKKTEKFYALTVCGYAIQATSILLLVVCLWFRNPSGGVAALAMNTFGGSIGTTTTLVGLLANSSAENTGVVVGCSYLFRSLGSSIGLSIISAVLQQVLRMQLTVVLADSDEARLIQERVRRNLDNISYLPPYIADRVRDSYQQATLASLTPALAFSAMAFFIALKVRERTLRD